MDSNIIEQKKIDLQNQIQAIDEQIVKLESSLSELSQKYAPQAMSDDDLEAQIASNRARRIKKDNNAQVQWNWLKNREDAEHRFQQSLNNTNASQMRMKVNGAANDIRQKQISNLLFVGRTHKVYWGRGIH